MSFPTTSILELPAQLACVLQEKDSFPDDFDEAEVSFVLERELGECGEISEDQRKASFAEIAALQLVLEEDFGKSLWGTRYAPYVDIQRRDGTRFLFPDIANVDVAVIQYWSKRATEAKHPVLKARYADVIWEMTKAATSGKPSFPMAQGAIDAYIECGTKFPNTDTAEDRLERALELALSLGDKIRAASVLDAMFKLLDVAEHPGSRLSWLFDLPYRMNGVAFTSEQESKVIQGIEAELQCICGSENPVGLVAKEPALRLASFYEKRGQAEDVKRVIRSYGDALAKFAVKAQGLVAMHWYQEAYGIYLKYGLKEEAEKFLIAAKEKGEEAKGQMIRHSQSVEIPIDEMAAFLNGITEGGLVETMTRIAFSMYPKLDEVSKQLDDTEKQAKLLSMIPVAKMGENQVIARAGSIEADREGRMMFQMADELNYTTIFLEKAFDHARERYEFTSKTVLPLLYESPLFDPARTMLLEQAIDAYLVDDHVKAIHVLVPQIEHCLRRLLAMLGKPTNKHRRSDLGVMIEKSLNDILEAEPVIKQCLGDDATFYLRVLLCDPRGFNVRNDLAHGLMAPENFNRFLSDRLMHVVFFLAQLRGSPVSKSKEQL
jgi:hypothetical protein